MDLLTPEYHTHGWRAAVVARFNALPPVPTAVVHPCDATALGAAVEAAVEGLITPILAGPEGKIRAAADAAGLDISRLRMTRRRNTPTIPWHGQSLICLAVAPVAGTSTASSAYHAGSSARTGSVN